jgi:predicted RNase H-like HicB family nuclease
MRYAVIIEKGADCYGAYVPDLPGCSVVADSEKQALALIRDAVDLLSGRSEDQGLSRSGPNQPRHRN